jgi:drug/metabolite transporter (DMT)-like permease
MTSLLGLGVLLLIAADAVVGVRLVLLARRTRQVPELALGAALLLMGAIGYPLSIAARKGLGAEAGLAHASLGAALAFQNAGCAAMAVATVWTFRRATPWARRAAGLFALAFAASWTFQAASGDFRNASGGTLPYWIGFSLRALAFAWSAAESWAYYGVQRRRLRLGLADAEVVDRFRLWALSATGVTGGFAIFLAALLTGTDVAASAWVLASTSAVGCVSGVTLWLAFLPPRWYLRRFQRQPSRATHAQEG